MDTDLRHEGEAFILQALPKLEAQTGQPSSNSTDSSAQDTPTETPAPGSASDPGSPEQHYKALTVVQRCYNALGALWSERSDLVSWSGSAL